MKKTAFTLMEILLAMSIIGVLAVATINNIGKVQSNKTKEAFRNCYNHMEQTVASIISDESIYPYVRWGSTLDSTGKVRRYPIRTFNMTEDISYFMGTNGTSMLFPHVFISKSATTSKLISGPCSNCTLKNGSYWVLCYNSSQSEGKITDISKADYTIAFDVNGRNNGTDCPYSGSELKSGPVSCAKPDTFKFGLTYDNRIITDNRQVYDGKSLAIYMRNNFGYGDDSTPQVLNAN